jgi:hypothetical protein
MAKGQQRSNKEVRKPKKEKLAAKPSATLGSQVKQAANFNSPGKKPKN